MLKDLEQPIDCVIRINQESLQLEIKNEQQIITSYAVQLGSKYPVLRIIKKTNNLSDLVLSESSTFRIKSKDNQQRDLLQMSIQAFSGRKIMSAAKPRNAAKANQPKTQKIQSGPSLKA